MLCKKNKKENFKYINIIVYIGCGYIYVYKNINNVLVKYILNLW